MIPSLKFKDRDDEYICLMKRPRMGSYLDDYTPIRTIEVLNIGNNVSTEYLRGYFEFVAGVGQVTNVTIESSKSVSNTRVAYVTFLLPDDAAMMLTNHQCLRFSIKQADASHQPKLDSTTLKFEDINDDCLLTIASYLRPIDLLNLSQTSKRFKSIEAHMYRKYSNVSFGGHLVKSEEVQVVLKELSPYIRQINWLYLPSDELELIPKYCGDVKVLRLEGPLLLNNDIVNQTYFKNIESLEIDSASHLTDAAMMAIVTSTNLKALALRYCRRINGSFFDQWMDCSLESLKIDRSLAVCNSFLNVCSSGRFNMLAKLCLDCNELTAEKIDLLQSLKNVRSLTLSNVDNQLATYANTSLHKLLPRLVTLKIFAGSNALEVNLQSVLDLMISLADLKHFSHTSMCWKLLHMIREVRERGKQPLIEIGISQRLYRDPGKMNFGAAAKHVIKLTFVKRYGVHNMG